MAVIVFVLNSSSSSQTLSQSAVLGSVGSTVVSPLDQLSSADIAVNVARLTNLAEATSAANHADTVNSQLAVSQAEDTVVAKPQIVVTSFKSNRDIKLYVTKTGDTVSKLAASFHISSDSIRVSNNLTSDQLTVGTKLYIPPINGIVYVVKAGDTPASLASKYSSDKDQIIAFNDAELSGIKPGERIIIPNGILPIATNGTPQFTGFFAYAPIYGFNGYDFGWCTWYVANRRAELGHPVPSNLGDAFSWFYLAQRSGLSTGYEPRVGAVVVRLGGDHVAVVEKVNADGSFWVSEMNSSGQKSMTDSTPTGGWGVRDYKVYSSASGVGFIY